MSEKYNKNIALRVFNRLFESTKDNGFYSLSNEEHIDLIKNSFIQHNEFELDNHDYVYKTAYHSENHCVLKSQYIGIHNGELRNKPSIAIYDDLGACVMGNPPPCSSGCASASGC